PNAQGLRGEDDASCCARHLRVLPCASGDSGSRRAAELDYREPGEPKLPARPSASPTVDLVHHGVLWPAAAVLLLAPGAAFLSVVEGPLRNGCPPQPPC